MTQREVLVFGGTTEGRELVEWLVGPEAGFAAPVAVTVCTATEYGGSLVAAVPQVHVISERLNADAMRALMHMRAFACVVDATHPYAAAVSANIAQAAQDAGLPLLRVLREGEPDGPWTGAADAASAAAIVAQCSGNVLLTTGSKELSVFVRGIPDYRERLYARILPAAESLLIARELDVPLAHIIAMQGPFSEELNRALIHEFDIRVLVTKASGAAGGFWEKVRAAQECGCELVVIHRPTREGGMTLQEACEELRRMLGGACQ